MTTRTLDPAMAHTVERWNRAHPNHPDVMLWYNPTSVHASWIETILGVAVRQWTYQGRWEVGVVFPFIPKGFTKLCHYLGRGQWFLKLFTWSKKNMQGQDTGYAEPDGRIFLALRLADTTRRRHYEQTFEEPEERAAREQQQERRDLAHEMHSRYSKFQSPIVNIKPTSPQRALRADWRWRHR